MKEFLVFLIIVLAILAFSFFIFTPRGDNATLTVEATINERGEVVVADVITRGTPAALENAVIVAVLNLRFRPALQDGKPVAVKVQFPVKMRRVEGQWQLSGKPKNAA